MNYFLEMSLYAVGLPFLVMLSMLLLPKIGAIMKFYDITIDNLKTILGAFILPISIILSTIICVKINMKETKRKRSSYIYQYFVFIPFVLFIIIYGAI